MKELYICNENVLEEKNFIIKWIEEIKDEIIVIKKNKNVIKVFSSICPHFGGQLYYDASKKTIRCKWHDWRFDCSTGACLTFKIKSLLRTYDFKIHSRNLKQYKINKKESKIFLVLK
jgi:nitrite reductase/ring-hydroxylating ferredoxin subunit